MQVTRYDGSDELIGPLEATEIQAAFTRALEDPDVASVAIHKPGAIVQRSNGKHYILDPAGQWRRIEPKKHEDVKPGVCRICGCTDDNACEGGCSWVNKDHTLCSACAEGRNHAK